MPYIALKKRTVNERKAYIEGYKAACNSFLTTLERYLDDMTKAVDMNIHMFEETQIMLRKECDEDDE